MCSVPFANLEFYNTPDGDIMLKEVGKPARPFREADRDIISKSTMNRTYYEYRVVHRFIRCNFGEYDQYRLDINYRGQLQFEEVRCPLRGECRYEGVICKPELDTRLTEREMEVFRLIAATSRPAR